MAIVSTDQQQGLRRMFFGDPDSPPATGDGVSNASPAPIGAPPIPKGAMYSQMASAAAPAAPTPAASPSPSPSPIAPGGEPSFSAGDIAAHMQPVMTRSDFDAANPDASKAYMPARPVGAFEGPHAGLRRGLGTIAAGLAEFGGEMNYHPGMGSRFIDRWNDQDLAQRQYDANAPRFQAEAGNKAYQEYLGTEQSRASTGKTQVETGVQAQNIPLQEQASKLYGQLRDAWQNKSQPDFDKFAQATLAGAPPALARMVAPHLNDIKQLPQTGKGYTINMQDDLPKSVQIYGKDYDRNDPELAKQPGGQEAIADFDRAMAAHKQKIGETMDTEQRKATIQGEAQGRAFAQQAQQQQNQQTFQQTETARAAAAKHLGDLRSAQNQNELVQQLASSKSPTDQTSLAFKALGLDLPDGVHRINEAELNAIRNQGSLPDRAYRALLNWTTGQQFAPEILQDISATAQRIAQSKMKTANDNLEDVHRLYGYRAPGSDERGRFDAQPQQQPAPGAQGGGQGGGQALTLTRAQIEQAARDHNMTYAQAKADAVKQGHKVQD